jgi:hypothetical protein
MEAFDYRDVSGNCTLGNLIRDSCGVGSDLNTVLTFKQIYRRNCCKSGGTRYGCHWCKPGTVAPAYGGATDDPAIFLFQTSVRATPALADVLLGLALCVIHFTSLKFVLQASCVSTTHVSSVLLSLLLFLPSTAHSC